MLDELVASAHPTPVDPVAVGERAMTTVRRVGLVPHRERGEAHELAKHTAAWLGEHGVEVRVPADDAEASGLDARGGRRATASPRASTS